MSQCDACGGCGGCGSCGGCDGELVLAPGEIQMLRTLGQIPFLPVARRADSETPIYLEETALPVSEYSLILACLEKRGLISLDFDKPLINFDSSAYAAYPICGSMALTARGQKVVEILETQGVQAEAPDV